MMPVCAAGRTCRLIVQQTQMTCNAIAARCRFSTPEYVFIKPGSAWQNAFVESFNGQLRDGLLAIRVLQSLLEAKVLTEDYSQPANSYRPNHPLSTAHRTASILIG